MRYKKLKLSVVFLLVLETATIQAQNSISASGGNASGSGGTVSYSVGQVVYTTYTGSNGSMAQGVQQPFEISVLTAIEGAKDISLELSVYPNPAQEFIKLKIENYEVENLRYQLYDINGNLLQNNIIEGNETNISMKYFLPSLYLLKIFQGNAEIKTFKIIKH